MAAAGLVGIVSLFSQSTPQARADLYADAANAGTAMFYFARDLSGLFSDDPALTEQYRRTIENERSRLKAVLVADPLGCDVLFAWQGLYCAYRELGLREESIRENEAALAYARQNKLTNMEMVVSDGLGNTHAAFGDYPAARKAYLDSLALRQASPGNRNDPHHGEPGYEGDKARDVMFLYCRLAVLSIAENDLPQAWQWHEQAETSVRQWIDTTCEVNGVTTPSDATLWGLWNALPAEYRDPKTPLPTEDDIKNPAPPYPLDFYPGEGQFHLIGAVLYHEAVLHRLSGDHPAAHQALDRAETLSDVLTRWPGNDEYHLPLLFRLELTRLAIIEHDYAAALHHLDRAEQYDAAIRDYFAKQAAGQIDAPTVPDVHKLPLSPLRRAEMNLLRGVALLGLEEAAPACGTGVSPVDADARHAGARIPSRIITAETPVPPREGEAPAVAADPRVGRPGQGEAPAKPVGRVPPAASEPRVPTRGQDAGPTAPTTGGTPVPQPVGRVPPAASEPRVPTRGQDAEPGSVGPPWPTFAPAPTAGPPAPMTPRRAEALRLIERALATPEKLAAARPAEQREKFLSQFAAWAQLAGQTTKERQRSD